MDESAKNVDGMFVFEKTYKDPIEAELYSPAYFRAIGFGDASVRLIGPNTQTGGGEVSSPYDVFLGMISKPSTQEGESKPTEESWFSRLYASIFSYTQKKEEPKDKPEESLEKEAVEAPTLTEESIQKPKEEPEESLEKETVEEPTTIHSDNPEHSIEESIQKEPRVFWQVSIPNPGAKLDTKTCPYSDKEAVMKQRLKAPNQKYEMQGRVYCIGDRKIVLGEVVPIEPLQSPKYI